MTTQPEALQLAEYHEHLADIPPKAAEDGFILRTARELRRLHAENERLTNLCYDYTGQITALRAAEQMRTRIDAMKERKKNHE